LKWASAAVRLLYGHVLDLNLDALDAGRQGFVEQFTAEADRQPSYGRKNFCLRDANVISVK